MASFLKKLFGVSGNEQSGGLSPARGDPIEYQGLEVQAAPEPEGDQWRLAGYIVKESQQGRMERQFLRADLFTSHNEASEFAIRKGKQIIDEQGARLFADGEKNGRV